jgi:hypothetical protein
MSSVLEDELERACKLLESATPEAMEASATTLEGVARELGVLFNARHRHSISVEEARRLRARACKARMLLELASRFHARCWDILAGMNAGYTARGSPAALSLRGRISLSG